LNRTGIEYLDFTWNPIVGCSGFGCAVKNACWAKGQAKRRKHECNDCYTFTPHLHDERLNQPLQRRAPSRIGVCFMSDLFGDFVQIEWTEQVFKVMKWAPWHTFLCLTKQAHNLVRKETPVFPSNVWMGVSVNCVRDLERLEYLKQCDAKVKFGSFEPLFEDLGSFDLTGIDWIVIGAQKRPTIQPKTEWVEKLIQVADNAGCKIFMKNNLECRVKLEYFLKRGFEEIPEVKIKCQQ
jgi:protein gp37